jgi:hypothetical protein
MPADAENDTGGQVVAGLNPVSPTGVSPVQSMFSGSRQGVCAAAVPYRLALAARCRPGALLLEAITGGAFRYTFALGLTKATTFGCACLSRVNRSSRTWCSAKNAATVATATVAHVPKADQPSGDTC